MIGRLKGNVPSYAVKVLNISVRMCGPFFFLSILIFKHSVQPPATICLLPNALHYKVYSTPRAAFFVQPEATHLLSRTFMFKHLITHSLLVISLNDYETFFVCVNVKILGLSID